MQSVPPCPAKHTVGVPFECSSCRPHDPSAAETCALFRNRADLLSGGVDEAVEEGSTEVADGSSLVSFSVRTNDGSPFDLDHDMFLACTVLVLVDLLTNGILSGTGAWLGVGSGLRIVTFSTVSVVEVAGGLGTLAAGAETAASLGVRDTCLGG